MAGTYGQPVFDMAKEWMEDNRDIFPAADFDALVDLLARDLQSALEDFTEYPDLTLTHLRRMQERER